MHILFLALDVNVDLDRGDGIHVRELAENLSVLGHELLVVAETQEGATDHQVSIFERPRSTLAQVVLAHRLARGWADVIYERRTSPKVGWTVSLLTGIPFVVEINGVLDEELRSSTGEFRPNCSVRRVIRKRMIRKASRVIAVSEGVRSAVVSTYGLMASQVVAVPNGANTELFRPLDK